MKKVLIICMSIGQDYYDLLVEALGKDVSVDLITGSDIIGERVYKSPAHDATSIMSRFKCWIDHYRYVMKWAKKRVGARYDLVFCVSNPPINSYIGLLLKKMFHAKFVYMNWDIYPQVIESMMKGIVPGVTSKLWNLWNANNYKKIDQIITIGEVVKDSIQERIPTDLGIKVIPIPVDTDEIKPLDPSSNPFIKGHGLEGKFIVLYSGKMGRGHNIEIILEAAKHLEKYEDILFAFIGEGEKIGLVSDYIKAGHNNVLYFPLQPDDVYPYSIACGTVGVVSQERKAARYFMPSKTYSMMAAGEAILGICSEYDDLQQLIENNGIGYAVKDNKVRTLCKYIIYMYDHPEETKIMRDRAREVALSDYSREEVLKKYKAFFKSLL